MATVGQLIVSLGLNTKQFDKNLKSVTKNLETLGREITRIGKGMSLAVTAPLAGIGIAAIKASGQLEGAFKGIKSATQDLLKTLGADLIEGFKLDDILADLSRSIRQLTSAWQKLSPETKKTVFELGLIAAAIGPVLVGMGSLITTLAGSIKGISAFMALGGGWVGILVAAAAAIAVLIEEMGGIDVALGFWSDAFDAFVERDWKRLQFIFQGGGLREPTKTESILQGIKKTMAEVTAAMQEMGKTPIQGNLESRFIDLAISIQRARNEAGFLTVGMREVDREVARTEAELKLLEQATREAFAEKNSDLVTKLSNQLGEARLKLDELKVAAQTTAITFGEAFGTLVKSMEVTAQTVVTSIGSIIQTVVQGIGDAVATAIVEGGKASEIFRNLLKQVAKAVIASLVAIGVQYLLFAIIGSVVAASIGSSHLAVQAGILYAATVAAAVESMGLLGLITGPLLATGAVAGMLGGAAASGKAGAAVGAALATPAAEGGIATRPTLVQVAEVPSARPEVIAPLRKLKEMLGLEQHIFFQVGDRVIASAAVRGMPEILRIQGIGK